MSTDDKKHCCCHGSCGAESAENESRQEETCCGKHSGEHECGCGCHEDSSNGEESKSDRVFDPDSIPDVPLPEPTLIMLATNLASQAMVSMGVFANPLTNKATFRLNQAKHLIDTIQLIFDKTAGNRTPEETKTLESMLGELQMVFVAATNEKQKRDAAKG